MMMLDDTRDRDRIAANIGLAVLLTSVLPLAYVANSTLATFIMLGAITLAWIAAVIRPRYRF